MTSTDKLNSGLCVKMLRFSEIRVTPLRVELFAIILGFGNKKFSTDDVHHEILYRKIPISNAAVIINLKLFCIRGLITDISDALLPEQRVGRPKKIFVLSGKGIVR